MQGLFERGVEEFNGQFFFEAHDTWEELWRETSGPDKLFYQGLIQTAVGFHHLSNKNYKGACSQFGKAIAKLEQYMPTYHGLETQQLVDRLRLCSSDAECLRNGETMQFEESKIPQIQSSETE
jgi:predicted metal-dependent hydrolase